MKATRTLLWLTLTGALVFALALAGARAYHWGPWAAVESSPAPLVSGALGEARYREVLAAAAGAPLEPAVALRLARGSREGLEVRLDSLARRLDPAAGDWRPLFVALETRGPDTDDAVLALYREELARAAAFCARSELFPLPPALPEVFVVANEPLQKLFPLALYLGDGKLGVTLAGSGGRRKHCAVCVPPLAVHEAYPGHHVAFRHLAQREVPTLTGTSAFFHEGWALYGEVVMWELGYWQGDPARELAALRLMALRALRAELDVTLHTRSMTPEAVRHAYVELAGLDATAAEQELAGHLQWPTRKASYLLGALQVLALREAVQPRSQGELRAFHERLLERAGLLPAVARERFGVELPPPDHWPPLLPPPAQAAP